MKRVPSQRYLYIRGDTYYFRRGVPKDVRHAFGGKPDDWKSLDTSDLAVARTRLQREIEAFETRVADARNQLAPAMVANAPYVPSNAEIEAAVREAHRQRKERVRPINKADRRVRGQDVTKEGGIWCVRITPEAGGTKSGDARIVPLHPHLIEQGFLKVAKAEEGPMFYDPSRSRGGALAHPQSKKVGERLAKWVRDVVDRTHDARKLDASVLRRPPRARQFQSWA